METKEPDSRLSVRKEDLDDQELYRLNQVINDLYSKVSTARDETADAAGKFTRSGVIKSPNDQSTNPVPILPSTGIPQPGAGDWTLNSVVYSAGEDGLQYGFASATISNKSAAVDYYSMFIQDYSSGYVDTNGTAVTLTAASKEAGNTFENCVANQVININGVAYTIASAPVSPFESLTLTTSAGVQSNVYFNLNPVNGGKWEEIASDAEAGTWQLRPPTGWDVPCCITASTKDEKTYQPEDNVNYKRLVFAPWADAPQVTNFSVTVEQQDPTTTDIPSGKFVVNFTKPLDPEYYYASVERLWYVNSSFTGNIGATAVVDIVGNTVTYNSTSSIYGAYFKGQLFNNIQPGDTVYIDVGPSLPETSSYIVSEVISNTQIKLTTNPPAGTERLFAQWGRVAGEINPFTQTDYWPLPTSAEYWKFRCRSVNHREIANNTAFPTSNVTVPASGGITPLTPATQPGSGDWSLNALQYSTDEAGNSSIFVSATITTPAANADYYSLFWQRTSTPVSGDWIEIAADATAGTWQEWPSAGATYVVAIAANKNTYKLDQPDESIPSYYKSLVIPAWGPADQVTGFSVTVETQNRAGIPSGRFVFNFTKPSDPDYYYAQISRIATDATYTPLPGAVYGVVAGEVNPTKQTDWWPLPATAEYWTFKSESVNYRKEFNTTSAPISNVSVSTSSGITQIAPATITTAAFASTIRPVDLVSTASISVSSIVVASNTGTVTTSSAHGLASGRQVAIFGGTGTSSKLNGLYAITVTGANTFTITTSGVSNGTYSAGLSEVPLPSLPSATYPSGAVAFMTANTKLYRSNGTSWTSAADGSDIISNSITAGQIAAGAISTTELFAGEILVGQGSGKPTRFKVVDSSSNTIGFIGDDSSIPFVGAYFVNLRIGPNISTPIISASSSGVSINGATFSLAANGITTTIDNTTSGGYTAGLRIVNTAADKLIQLGLDGPSNYPSFRVNDTSANSGFVLSVTNTGGSATFNDLAGSSGVEIQGQYSTYTTGGFRGSITTGRIQATREFQLGSTATAGYVLTTDAQGVGTWQSLPGGGISSINSQTGPAITIAASTGISIASATNTITITNSGVTSLTGTTNQVNVSASTGSVTLSLPQDIATTSSPTFTAVNTATVGPTSATALNLRTDNTTRWSIDSAGMLSPGANDTYDIGLTGTRVRTIYSRAGEFYVSGGTSTSDYLTTRKLNIYDSTGTNAGWDIQATASLTSSLLIRDNSGNSVIQFVRTTGSDYADVYVDLLPSPNNGQKLGSASYMWSAIHVTDIYTSGGSVYGSLDPAATNTYTIGSTSKRWSQVNTVALNATGTITFPTGASNGYVWTSDASGVGSWQAVSGSSQWTTSGSDIYRSTGIVTVGATTPTVRLGQNFNVNYSNDYSGIAINTWSSTGSHGSIVDFNKSASSTIGTQSAVASGNSLGLLVFRGSDGTSFQRSSEIIAEVDSSVSSGIVPGRISLRTANSSGVMTDRVRIDSTGKIGFGTTTPSQPINASVTDSSTGATSSISGSDTLAGYYGQTFASPSSNPAGIRLYTSAYQEVTSTTGGANVTVSGSVSRANHSGSTLIAAAYGSQSFVFNSGTGNIDSAVGHLYGTYIVGSGNIVNNFGIVVGTPVLTSSGTITNNYGIYIQDQNIGTTKWGIYVDGSSVNSYFAGRIGIGATPDALLTVNTIASFGDGAAATPSIAHKGDLNTGFWFPAADTIAASTAGVERWRINSSGVLVPGASDTYDIGVTSPSLNRARNIYSQSINTASVDVVSGTSVSSYWRHSLSGSSTYRLSSGGGSPQIELQATVVSSSNTQFGIRGTLYPLDTTGSNGDLGYSSIPWRSLYINGLISANGSVGSNGQLLSTNGTTLAQWVNITSQLTGGTGVTISGTTNATISIGQAVGTTSNVTFNSITLANGNTNGISLKDTGGTARVCLTIGSDNNLYLDNNDSTYDIYIRPGASRYTFVDGAYFAPFTNNGISLGYNGQGWSNVYSYAYWAHNGTSWTAGWTGTFTADGQTVTVQDGIITNVV
jgi:hypothetical protein